jgi:hypothetical protein
MKRPGWLTLASFGICVGLYFLLNSYPIQMSWWVFKEFVNPKLEEQTEANYKTKSNEYLLNKMKTSKIFAEVDIAEVVLRGRDDKRVVDVLLDLISSNDDQIRRSAFQSLAFWNDPRIPPILEKVVKQGRGDRDYLDALDCLSIMHYDPIYLEILRNARDGHELALTVGMLERFPEKTETLPALRKIAEGAPELYVQERARETITSIESARVKEIQ